MKIVIIEDEAIIARRITRMTETFFGNRLSSLHTFDSLSEGQKFLSENSIDLLLLDLNLNGENGFDILKTVTTQSFHVIIISAYRDKAITAFEYGVLDFVPKPFNQERLNKAFFRLGKEPREEGKMKYLSILKRGLQVLINVEEVVFIKGARVHTEIHLKDGTKEIHNKSLDNLGHLLPATFERVHKSYLADMNQASGISATSGGKYTLQFQNGEQIPVSRSKYKYLKETYLI